MRRGVHEEVQVVVKVGGVEGEAELGVDRLERRAAVGHQRHRAHGVGRLVHL
jgi:hypothetical protein